MSESTKDNVNKALIHYLDPEWQENIFQTIYMLILIKTNVAVLVQYLADQYICLAQVTAFVCNEKPF